MRWFVEISSIGANSDPPVKMCVEAPQWQPALQKVRALRGDEGSLGHFSIEVLDEGFRAVDPMMRLRYFVRKAPDDAPLTTSVPASTPAAPVAKPEPLDEAPRARPPMETSPFGSPGTAALVDTPPPPPASRPLPNKKATVQGMPAVSGAAVRKGTVPGMAAITAPILAAATAAAAAKPKAPATPTPTGPVVAHKVHSSREENSSSSSPLTYREFVYVVADGTTESSAKGLLIDRLDNLVKTLGAAQNKFVQLAVFDHAYQGRPQRKALATLAWKEWRGETVIGYPGRNGDAAKEEVIEPEPVNSEPVKEPAKEPVKPEPVKEPVKPEPIKETPAPAPAVATPAPAKAVAAPAVATPAPIKAAATPAPVKAAAAPAPIKAAATPAPIKAAATPAPIKAAATPAPAKASVSAPATKPSGSATAAAAAPSKVSPSTPASAATSAPAKVSPSTPAPAAAAAPSKVSPSTPAPAPTAKSSSSSSSVAKASYPPPRVKTADEVMAELSGAVTDLGFLSHALEGADFVVTLVKEKFPSEVILLWFYDADKRELVLVRQTGGTIDQYLTRISEKTGLAQAALRSQRAVVIPDAARDPRANEERWKNMGIEPKSVVVAPVMHSGKPYGLLEILNPRSGARYGTVENNGLTYLGQQLAEFMASNGGVILDSDRILAGAKRIVS